MLPASNLFTFSLLILVLFLGVFFLNSQCLVCHIKHFFSSVAVFVSSVEIVKFLWSFMCRRRRRRRLRHPPGASVINTYFSAENYQLMHYTAAAMTEKGIIYFMCSDKTKRKKYLQVGVVYCYRFPFSFFFVCCWFASKARTIKLLKVLATNDAYTHEHIRTLKTLLMLSSMSRSGRRSRMQQTNETP